MWLEVGLHMGNWEGEFSLNYLGRTMNKTIRCSHTHVEVRRGKVEGLSLNSGFPFLFKNI